MNILTWFTSGISPNYVPKEYSCLPGFILKLQEGRVIYQMKSIKKIKYFNFKELKKVKKIPLTEFNKLGKETYNNRHN
jgi:GLPGLI family protein